ncbi:MAG: GNAT family N-acetyltransferase [Coriobacteriia bacterium]
MVDSEIHIRSFAPDDLGAVRRLIHRTIETCYIGVYPSRTVDFFKEFHSPARILERHNDGHVLVACLDGTVVATGALVDDEISGMFVDPERQGRGIGSLIMERLEYWAAEKSLGPMP